MALVHEFFILPKEIFHVDLALLDYYDHHPLDAQQNKYPQGSLKAQAEAVDSFLDNFYLRNHSTRAIIHDDYILEYMEHFMGINTLHNGYILSPGLNYYAFSVIQPCDMDSFLGIFKDISTRLGK